MKPRAVHQLVHTLARNDAIGEHTLEVQKLLRDSGYQSNIYSEFGVRGAEDLRQSVDALAVEVRNVSTVGEVVVLFHHSTGTPLVDRLLSWDVPFVVNYHNITPARYFAPFDQRATGEMVHGRRQTEALRAKAIGAICDSTFNARDYDDSLPASVRVASILRDWQVAETSAHRSPNSWIFVGRISPNKAQHDLIAALAVYRSMYAVDATLTLVGYGSPAGYAVAVEQMAADLGIASAVRVVSHVSDAELSELYAQSGTFVCMSEHEGFCVPLVEAMRAGLPIVAFSSSAVTETLGDGGVLLTRKDPCTVAAAIHLVATDMALAGQLIEAGHIRSEQFSLANSRRNFTAALDAILNNDDRP